MQVVPSPVGSRLLPGLADFGRGADLLGLISLNINKIPSVFPGSGTSFQNHVLFLSFQLGAFAGVPKWEATGLILGIRMQGW